MQVFILVCLLFLFVLLSTIVTKIIMKGSCIYCNKACVKKCVKHEECMETDMREYLNGR